MSKKIEIVDKKSAKDFVHCTCLAFTMQTVVAALVMYITSPGVAVEQSRISSIYATPGFLSKETLLQFLLVSFLTALLRHIFMSDRVLHIPSIALRITLMFAFEIAMLAVVVLSCGWFHSVSVGAWIGFVIGALPCLIAGIILAFKTEIRENEEMNEALRKKQEEEKNRE